MRIALASSVALLGCLRPNPAFEDGSEIADESDSFESTIEESQGDGESGESSSESSGSDDASTDDASSEASSDDASTDASSTDTNSTDGTDETTEEPPPLCFAEDIDDIDIGLLLTGQLLPNPGCDELVFTGHLKSGDGGVYQLDSCLCGETCLIADPYVLTLDIPDPDLLPNVPDCLKIDLRRKSDCSVGSLTIWDLDEGDVAPPVWIGSRESTDPDTFDSFGVSKSTIGECACDGCGDPPILSELKVDYLGDGFFLAEGESGQLQDDNFDWIVRSFSSHYYPAANAEWYGWVLDRL